MPARPTQMTSNSPPFVRKDAVPESEDGDDEPLFELDIEESDAVKTKLSSSDDLLLRPFRGWQEEAGSDASQMESSMDSEPFQSRDADSEIDLDLEADRPGEIGLCRFHWNTLASYTDHCFSGPAGEGFEEGTGADSGI